MSSRPLLLDGLQASQLFTSSLSTDVQSSNDVLTVGIMPSIKKSQIAQMVQVKYQAEVGQIYTLTTTITPAGSTNYIITLGDTNRTRNGVQEQLKRYSYLTPSDVTTLGATAALQREAINVELIALINADTATMFVTAATTAGGTGMTITDATGYYPVNAQGMTVRQGATFVQTCCDSNRGGFTGTEAVITTAANYGFGIGAQLATYEPTIDQMWGNLLSGYLGGTAPKTSAGVYASSGQQYDGFAITGLAPSSTSTGHSQTAYIPFNYIAYVDNGSGTSTTNLTGYKAFARQWRKNASAMYKNDQAVVIEYFDKPIVFQDPLGAAPTGTADTLGWQLSPYGALNRTNIGTQTIVAPVLDATGLLIDQDDTDTEGSHTSANQQTLGDQQFTVGKSEFSVICTVVMGDYTDAAFMVGFRKKAAYTAVFNAYTDYATIGNGSSALGTTYINGDLIVTRAELNSGGILETVSAVAPSDTVSIEYMIKVALDGTVTAYANGVSYPIYSTGTTTMVFDAGDVLIPCYQIVNIASGNPACSISEFVALNTKDGLVAIG